MKSWAIKTTIVAASLVFASVVVWYCVGRGVFCQACNLDMLLKRCDVVSAETSELHTDKALWHDGTTSVWMRSYDAARRAGVREKAQRDAIYAFRAGRYIGKVHLDAHGTYYHPKVTNVPGGLLVSSYRFGKTGVEPKDMEYILQIHYISNAGANCVLEHAFIPIQPSEGGRAVFGTYEVLNDTLGRCLVLWMQYEEPYQGRASAPVGVQGQSVYAWDSSSESFVEFEGDKRGHPGELKERKTKNGSERTENGSEKAPG